MKEEFRYQDFREASRRVLDHAETICGEYDSALTLRQLYYQFIARDLLPAGWIDPKYNARHGLAPDTKNTEKNYKRLGDLLSNGRLAGIINWNSIEDRVRRPVIWASYNSIREPIEDVLASFRLPRWEGQDCYVELWVEKDALASVLEPIAMKYHVTLMVNRGYSSQSAMHDAGERFKQQRDRACHLLYLGDHDPSGEDMVRDIQERLEMFKADVEVEKVALTMAQVKQYKCPPNPAKLSDSRADKYIAKYGRQSWEVDAIDPKEMVKLIERAIKKYLDREEMDEVIAREADCKARLQEFLDGSEL